MIPPPPPILPSPLLSLPPEVFDLIAKTLSLPALLRLSATSKSIRARTVDSATLWRRIEFWSLRPLGTVFHTTISSINDATVEKLFCHILGPNALNGVSEVTLNGTRITAKSVDRLLRNCRNIETLSIQYCYGVDLSALAVIFDTMVNEGKKLKLKRLLAYGAGLTPSTVIPPNYQPRQATPETASPSTRTIQSTRSTNPCSPSNPPTRSTRAPSTCPSVASAHNTPAHQRPRLADAVASPIRGFASSARPRTRASRAGLARHAGHAGLTGSSCAVPASQASRADSAAAGRASGACSHGGLCRRATSATSWSAVGAGGTWCCATSAPPRSASAAGPWCRASSIVAEQIENFVYHHIMYTKVESYQVLQRDECGKASVQHDGCIVELPVGGPYQIGDAHDILVGDIWICAGQSNMRGNGIYVDINPVDIEKSSPFVHSFQSREQWAVAEEPSHWLSESPRLIHHILPDPSNGGVKDKVPDTIPPRDPNRTRGISPVLTFAKERYARTGVPVGLVPSAHGGTSMKQWDPALRDKGEASLYGAMFERFKAVGGKVAGVLWYQGETDATMPAPEADEYQKRTLALVEAVRADFGQPLLPFYYVQIGRYVQIGDPYRWNVVREAQRTMLPLLRGPVGMVTAVDVELDDGIHLSTAGQKTVGRRLANAVDGMRSPDPKSVRYETRQFGGARRKYVVVAFRNVRDGLRANGRPMGFSLRLGPDELSVIHKVTLEETEARLHLNDVDLSKEVELWYGYGWNPICNVTDGMDMAVPAFGPIRVSEQGAV
ncbi:SGNH hydrolase-type esterase domain-containing protein [Jimgerdemannia flammicorona]|uniref:SGNH hydrolase-type esterase domain-containing protein n=1 Tax=Jimgerdemannia flammicorona TaxID=994334 RepID=A0A433PU51_9FUNG|nr:SGNH hydrolase-type esterase domain-containing protein [Jimgerdemannia flammicorona]